MKNTEDTCQLTIVLKSRKYMLEISKTKTILEAAIDAKIDSPYSCEGGFCTSCMAVITDGQVDIGDNTTLDEDEIAVGKTLTCIAKPTTDKLTVSFDI